MKTTCSNMSSQSATNITKSNMLHKDSGCIEEVKSYKCKFCPYLSLSQSAVQKHYTKNHVRLKQNNSSSRHGSLSVKRLQLKCPGCANVFFAKKSLKTHLISDHCVNQSDVKTLMKMSVQSNLLSVNSGQLETDKTLINNNPNSELIILNNKNNTQPKTNSTASSKLLPTDKKTAKASVRQLPIIDKADAESALDVTDLNSSVQKAMFYSDIENSNSNSNELAAELCNDKDFSNIGSVDHSTLIVINSGGLNSCTESHILLANALDESHVNKTDLSLNKDRTTLILTAAQSDEIKTIFPSSLEISELLSKTVTPKVAIPKLHKLNARKTVRVKCESQNNKKEKKETAKKKGSKKDNQHEKKHTEHNKLSSILNDIKGTDFTAKPETSSNNDIDHEYANLFVKQNASDTETLYRCQMPNCKVRMKSEANMDYHIQCHWSTLGFVCTHCNSKFAYWRLLCSHLWRLHGIDMELYQCDQCPYKTFSLAKLNNVHKLIHGDEKPFLCDSCPKAFKNQKQLRNHKNIHTRRYRELNHECTVCSRRFGNKRQLKLHVDGVHNKLRPFLCNFCGYKASTKSALALHIRSVHTHSKPFECTRCSYATADHNSLRRHKLRHNSSPKPYSCPHCAYECIQSSTYKIHLKNKHPQQEHNLIHGCSQCNYKSINRDNYTTHVASHSAAASTSTLDFSTRDNLAPVVTNAAASIVTALADSRSSDPTASNSEIIASLGGPNAAHGSSIMISHIDSAVPHIAPNGNSIMSRHDARYATRLGSGLQSVAAWHAPTDVGQRQQITLAAPVPVSHDGLLQTNNNGVIGLELQRKDTIKN